MGCLGFIVCFCKQKTAYEMRISDWSSDVCSSDLAGGLDLAVGDLAIDADQHAQHDRAGFAEAVGDRRVFRRTAAATTDLEGDGWRRSDHGRSDERRVGKECVRPVSTRLSPYP